MGGRGKEVGRNHPPPPDRPRIGLASLRIGSSTSRRASGRTVSLTHRKCCIGNVSWGIASWAIRHTTRIFPNTGPYTPSFKLQVMPRSRGRPSSVDGTAARKGGQTGRWPFLRRNLIHPPPPSRPSRFNFLPIHIRKPFPPEVNDAWRRGGHKHPHLHRGHGHGHKY